MDNLQIEQTEQPGTSTGIDVGPFHRATRRKARLRLALVGPAGSGKTYSALALARGMGGRWAMIDTEHGSGELYADLFEYDVVQLDPPYSPERYIALIEAAERGGYDGLIIDSLSHAWAGEGGLLQIHEMITDKSASSWAAWRKVTPMHNRLVEKILSARLHVICCFRTKTAWEVVEDNGKARPVKIGLAPVFREGVDYEFTTVFDLSPEGHVAASTKDRTSLFDGKYVVLESAHGAALRAWLEEGVPEPAPVVVVPAATETPPETEPPAPVASDERPRNIAPSVWQKLDELGLTVDDLRQYVAIRWGGEALDRLSAARSVALMRTMEKINSIEQWDEEKARWQKGS